MKQIIAVLAGLLLVSGCVSVPTTDPAELPAGQWSLDPDHASITWQVRHIGLSWYTARFDQAEASLDFDPEAPQDARLTAIVDVRSISTGDSDFDQTLLGSTWFDVERHPEIVFESNRIEVTGDTTGRVHGTLSIKGKHLDAVMETEFYGGGFNILERRQAIGFQGDILIDLEQIDMGGIARGFIGEQVRINIQAEFLREGP